MKLFKKLKNLFLRNHKQDSGAAEFKLPPLLTNLHRSSGGWTEGEKGPKCGCGMQTSVVFVEDAPHLICIFHQPDAGSYWPLPATKPLNWPVLTPEELDKVMMSVVPDPSLEDDTKTELN